MLESVCSATCWRNWGFGHGENSFYAPVRVRSRGKDGWERWLRLGGKFSTGWALKKGRDYAVRGLLAFQRIYDILVDNERGANDF